MNAFQYASQHESAGLQDRIWLVAKQESRRGELYKGEAKSKMSEMDRTHTVDDKNIMSTMNKFRQ